MGKIITDGITGWYMSCAFGARQPSRFSKLTATRVLGVAASSLVAGLRRGEMSWGEAIIDRAQDNMLP
jgi:hypothetical protein